ncbi:hypothetical protein KBY26_15425, partial [Ruegeria pomeroyi]|nr:hypothetical protein [Ruegeria pomeroyi]
EKHLQNARNLFKQTEPPLLQGHRDVGIPVVRSEISRDGKVVIYSTAKQTDEVNNPWDRP